MRLKHRDLARAAAGIIEHGAATERAAGWVRANARDVADRVNSDLDDAPAGICYEPRPRSQDVSDPTGHKATGRPDPIALAVAHMHRHLELATVLARRARRSAEQAENLARSLLAIDPEVAQVLAGADQLHNDPDDQRRHYACTVCGDTVSNTPADRLRAGRCQPCYLYRRRTGTDRPRHLWEQAGPPEEPEPLSVVRLCGHPLWGEHGEEPCGRPFMHEGACAAGAG